MKNMYAFINAAVKSGCSKVFVVGYQDGNGCIFTETDNLADAKRQAAIMISEGHKPFIDVYARHPA